MVSPSASRALVLARLAISMRLSAARVAAIPCWVSIFGRGVVSAAGDEGARTSGTVPVDWSGEEAVVVGAWLGGVGGATTVPPVAAAGATGALRSGRSRR